LTMEFNVVYVKRSYHQFKYSNTNALNYNVINICELILKGK